MDRVLDPLTDLAENADWPALVTALENSRNIPVDLQDAILEIVNTHIHNKSKIPSLDLHSVIALCHPSCNAKLKDRGKFCFLHLKSFKFPESMFLFLKLVALKLPVKEALEFLDSTNPYPNRYVDLLDQVPGCGLSIIRDPSGCQHISVGSVGQENIYHCHPGELLCYPIFNKSNRQLGPKTFQAIGWCTLKFKIDMEGLPVLQPRASANFHLSFALIGWPKQTNNQS